MTEAITQETYEEEYLLAIRAEIEIDALDFCDRPQCGHALTLAGEGIAFSNTFGPMDVKTEFTYETMTGRMSGRISMIVRNTDETLELVIEEKAESRAWEDMNGSCMAASSTKTFAGMNFNGEMCFEFLPEDMRKLEKGMDAIILFEGELK